MRLLAHPLTILGVVLAIFFYKELLLGRVFSPADQLLVQSPWATAAPPTFHTPSNPLRSDETLINFPHRFDIAEDVRRFGLTLWQDHTFAGSQETFSLHYLASWLYLPMLAFLFLGPGLANTVMYLTIPLYAGVSMYVLSSMLSRNTWARTFGAIAFALNGYSTVWLSSFVLPVIVATLPLGLYFALRFLEGRRIMHGILFSVALGGTLYFAYPPAVIIYSVITLIFVTCFWLADRRARIGPLVQLVGLGVAGLGLGMVALLPTIADLRHFATTTYHNPQMAIPVRFVKSFIFPNFQGNPVFNDWFSKIGNYCEYVAYQGALPLMLGGLGLGLAVLRRRAAPLALAAAITGILSFALAYVGPVIRAVNSLPILYDLNPARWTIGIDFALVVLSVVALDALLSVAPARPPRAALWVSIAVVIVAAIFGLITQPGELLHHDAFITRDTLVRLGLIAASAAALSMLALVRRNRGLLAPLVVGILAVDLVSFGHNFNPAIPAGEFYPVTPAIQFLQQHAGPYRVLPAGGTYYTDDFNVYGLDVITGYDHFRDERYIALLGDNLSAGERKLWSQSGFVIIAQQPHLEEDVFSLLSVKYAYFPTAPNDLVLAGWANWHTVYSGRDGTVLENQAVLPKQFLVDTAGAMRGVEHVAARPDRDRFGIDGGGTLVWSKPWSSDWKVLIDGHPAPTSRFQDYFLSVPLPAGHHDVALSFEPRVYLIGALGTALACLVLLLIGAAGPLRRRVRRRAETRRPPAAPARPPG